MALFARPDSGRDRITYMFPTPGALRGLGQTIYHTHRLEVVPTQVWLLSAPQIYGVKRHNLRNGVLWAERGPLKSFPDSCLYLVDVEYRIQYGLHGPADDITRWKKHVEAGAFYSPPFLGTRECLAEIVPVDDKAPVNLTLFEPAMSLSNNGPTWRVACVNGKITYPPETRRALQNRRRGVTPWSKED